ncbi:MAG: hypothetical protein KJ069_23180 [Anaerolineae bacterium]|nr:hypothetical protein [Anaerolineae bacterium]
MFKKLFGKRAAQEKWEAGLVWFRLRYGEATRPTWCINLLSRPQACGRIALYFRPGEPVSQLYLGLPETHTRLLQRMGADFGFSLKPKLPDVTIPAAGRMTAVVNLPWDKAFVAQITNESAFVSLVESPNKRGAYLPPPPAVKSGYDPAVWHLPHNPLPGLTLKPFWDGQPPPVHLIAAGPDTRCWLLGRSPSGIPLQLSGRVNIYGRQEAVADWLVHQVTQMVTADPSNLVVIDGAGDLVPRLKRQAAVTRLLGEQLAYVDLDGAWLAGGFNPLAAAPGESEAALVQRWQYWFQGMNVHPQGIHLLAEAQREGVGDIPALRKWLKQAERRGQYAATSTEPVLSLPKYSVPAVSSLGLALNRLTASRALREWLEWPVNRFDILPEGALFFACRGTGWDRQQLLRAVMLGVMAVTDVRLIVHGIGDLWRTSIGGEIPPPCHLILSNGPLLSQSHLVFTETEAAVADRLAARFGHDDKQMAENLQLLGRREAAVLVAGQMVLARW